MRSARRPAFPLLALVSAALLVPSRGASSQAVVPPPQPSPPSLEEVRKGMAVRSTGEVRGQQDGVGFATTAAQMARTWELSASPPAPEALGEAPLPGVLGVVCPHDDYLYAGRVYRKVLPLMTARTVVLVGVFHKYRSFGARDVLVFDPYRAWSAPDGEVPVSPLREAVLARMPRGTWVKDAASHDREHSLEPLVQWLKHARPDVEILPVVVPSASFARTAELATAFGEALAAEMKARGLVLGRDVAVAISADAVHYGADFRHVPFGEGGIEAYRRAVERDRALLSGPLSGPVEEAKARALHEAFVDPAAPDDYRLTWCGRFSIPTGLLVLARTARALGLPPPVARPVAYATSVGAPEL
ncbi:MAG: AmmeMemoRadiSam system protein B, partial [Acidobacteria bacterium ACB2]|nr:AmmeMemoRadiSam system protein B [Acidobacteria bacterium ACB2]